jgi:DNA-directed RNA polymerase specialized sigma24 family protein
VTSVAIDLRGVDHLVADPDRRLGEACKAAGLRRFHLRRRDSSTETVLVEGAYFHDVQDPVRFVRHALNDELRSRGATLDPDRYEECVSFLIEKLCRLAERYRPGQGSLSFSSLAYKVLRRRYTDFLRDTRGDSRYGTWSGGAEDCDAAGPVEENARARHLRVRDDTGRPVEPGVCRCGAQWVGNDGREQSVGELPILPGTSPGVVDGESFQALIDQLDHEHLSARARGTLNEIVRPMLEEGISNTDIARRLAKSRREVQRDLDRLRLELQELLR